MKKHLLEKMPARALAAFLIAWLAGANPVVSVHPARAAVAQAAKVYVFPYQGVYQSVPKEVLTQITDLIKNELKAASDVQLQKGPVFIPEATATEIKPLSDKALKQAEKLRLEGEQYFQQLAFDKAIKALKASFAMYENSLALMTDFEAAVQTLLVLAACYYQMEQEEEGAKMLVKVIRLRPELNLDPEKYPPMFRNVAEEIKKKLLLKARGELEVIANAEGATVYLDGRKVGESPVILKDLVPGEHYLRVEKAGLQPWADKVNVVSTQRIGVAASLGGVKKMAGPLGEIAESLQNNNLTAAVVKTIQQEGKNLGTDFVLVGGAAKMGANYRVGSFLVRVADGQLCAVKAFDLDPDLLGASVEVYNMAADLVKKTEACPQPESSATVALVDTAQKKTPQVKTISVGPVAPPPEPQGQVPQAPPPPPVAEPSRTPALPPAQPVAAAPVKPAPAAPAQPEKGPAVPGAAPALPPAVAMSTAPAAAPQVSEEGLVTTGSSAISAAPPAPVVVPVVEAIRPIDEEQSRRPGLMQKWWFWTLLGAVVIGGAAGGLYAAGVFEGSTSGASISVHWPVPH
jgi:tetratricopeptide (TPR) repeat protein